MATNSKAQKVKVVNNTNAFGGAYFVCMVGALVYFIQASDGFWNIILAFLKAAVWPAFLVHKAFTLLNI